MEREIVAILIDGDFYLRRAKYLWGEKSPKERASELIAYCKRHLKEHSGNVEIYDHLYRIFFYDCPPSDKNVYHPLLKKDICLKKARHTHGETRFTRNSNVHARLPCVLAGLQIMNFPFRFLQMLQKSC